MIFKSKYINRKFFSMNSRDFFDEGYYQGMIYGIEIERNKIILERAFDRVK